MQRATARFTNRTARSRRLAAAWGKVHATTLLRTHGRVGGKWFGAPMLVLITTGRKSGKTRETPLIYARDGEAIILLAANGGNDRAPSWWLNLKAAPTVDVVVCGARETRAWREVPAGPEYDRLYAVMVAAYPPGEHYPAMTTRHLPLLVLER